LNESSTLLVGGFAYDGRNAVVPMPVLVNVRASRRAAANVLALDPLDVRVRDGTRRAKTLVEVPLLTKDGPLTGVITDVLVPADVNVRLGTLRAKTLVEVPVLVSVRSGTFRAKTDVLVPVLVNVRSIGPPPAAHLNVSSRTQPRALVVQLAVVAIAVVAVTLIHADHSFPFVVAGRSMVMLMLPNVSDVTAISVVQNATTSSSACVSVAVVTAALLVPAVLLAAL
jgi:hypothetical protein